MSRVGCRSLSLSLWTYGCLCWKQQKDSLTWEPPDQFADTELERDLRAALTVQGIVSRVVEAERQERLQRVRAGSGAGAGAPLSSAACLNVRDLFAAQARAAQVTTSLPSYFPQHFSTDTAQLAAPLVRLPCVYAPTEPLRYGRFDGPCESCRAVAELKSSCDRGFPCQNCLQAHVRPLKAQPKVQTGSGKGKRKSKADPSEKEVADAQRLASALQHTERLVRAVARNSHRTARDPLVTLRSALVTVLQQLLTLKLSDAFHACLCEVRDAVNSRDDMVSRAAVEQQLELVARRTITLSGADSPQAAECQAVVRAAKQLLEQVRIYIK